MSLKNSRRQQKKLDRKVFISTTLFTITTLDRTNRSFLIVKNIYINMQLQRCNAIIIRNDKREKRNRKSSLKV